MVDVETTHKRDSSIDRLLELVFQGYDPRAYLKAATKLLIAGFIGVCVGWIAQPFFVTVLGLPYWMAYWPAVLAGYVANLRTQVSVKNIKLEKPLEK